MTTSSSDHVLEVVDVAKRFGGVQAVNGVNLAVTRGTPLGVIGPNGAGKTTLFSIVAGAVRPDTGSVSLNGQRIDGLKEYQVVRRGLARTYQNCRLFAELTVRENVMVAEENSRTMRDHASGSGAPSARGVRRRSASKTRRVDELLESFGIGAFARTRAGDLPFGLQRRVAVARAAATAAEVLLLDEPTAGMNEEETRDLAKLVTDLCERGFTVVVIEHDMSFVRTVCNEVVVLDRGAVISSGPVLAVQSDPKVKEAYLGAGVARAGERYRRIRRGEGREAGVAAGRP